MATLRIGPALAGFPAFPDPADLPPLQPVFGPGTLAFELAGYRFTFTGDFVSQPGFVVLTGTEVVNVATDQLAIGFALTGETPPAALPFNQFLGTLLNPDLYTDDILTAFFGGTGAFRTLDLTAFANPVVLDEPEGSVTGPDGERGVVNYASELDGFAFATVLGGAGSDRIGGNVGDNRIEGRAGDDVLSGRDGNDTLVGGAGRDLLLGGRGCDLLCGGAGDDILAGQAGSNRLKGGEGADRFVIGSGPGTDRILDLQAADRIELQGLASPGAFSLLAAGDDAILRFGARTVHIDDASVAEVAASLTTMPGWARFLSDRGVAVSIGSSDDLVVGGRGSDRITLGAGSDFASGGKGADRLLGCAGADVLWGDAGHDTLKGGSGDDLLSGGAGDDVIEGGPGSDTLTGGAGRDRFVFRSADGLLDRITDFDIGLDRLDLRGLFTVPVDLDDASQFLRITSPGPTFLTRFLEVDGDGASGPSGFVPLVQIDDVDDAVLLDPSTYLL